jgi:hypothetical protein
MAVVDRCEALLKEADLSPRITHARHYIALGTARRNFCWLRPQRAESHCTVNLWFKKGSRKRLFKRLEEAGLTVFWNPKAPSRLELREEDLEQKGEVLQEAFETSFAHAS